MYLRTLIFSVLWTAHSFAADDRIFELRTYYAAEGKLELLNARFRDHTTNLFTKHNIENIAYWVPENNKDNMLLYLLAYPDSEARTDSWNSFLSDPIWKAVKSESEINGKLVSKVDSIIMQLTDYSPPIPKALADGDSVVELRTYTTRPAKLENINARFQDHTIALFEKHGITNIAYFNLTGDQSGAANTLVYLVAHKDIQSRGVNFKSFSQDPAWKKAAKDSQIDGRILVNKGIDSVLMKATDYSPLK